MTKYTIDHRGRALRSVSHAVVAGATTVLLATSPLRAQHATLELDGGIEFPFGSLADSLGAGPAGGVGIGYEMSPRFGLALRGEVSRLNQDDGGLVTPGGPTGPAPDLTHWQFVAEGRLRPLSTTGSADLVLNAGAGVAVFRFAGDFFDERFRSTTTYPTVRGGAALEVRVSPRVALTAATRVKLVLSEEEDPPIPPFDETWFLNPSVGGRVSL
jgi:hypothetical protein